MPSDRPKRPEPVKRSYRFSGVAVSGLTPPRGIFKSKPAYQFTLASGGYQYMSGDVKSKGTTVAWDDEHTMEWTPDDDMWLAIVVRTGNGAPNTGFERTLSLKEWTTLNSAPVQLYHCHTVEVLDPANGNQKKRISPLSPVYVKISLTELEEVDLPPEHSTDAAEASTAIPPVVTPSRDAISPFSELPRPERDENQSKIGISPTDEVERSVEDANTTAEAMHPLPGLDAVSSAIGTVSNASESISGIGDAWKLLLENLEWFVQVMDTVSEVHPYAKVAWSILSAAYKVVKNQQDRDDNIRGLVEEMNKTYTFLRQAKGLRAKEAREGVLSSLARQTIDCAYFISSYAKKTNFWIRMVRQGRSKVDETVDQYKRSFEDLRKEFQLGSQLRTEIVTSLILEDVQSIASDLDLDKIPYTGGAGYEPSKQCLEGTRAALLDEVTRWVQDDSDDASNVFILFGPAGTGKSTIAHTIAHRFNRINRLGSSFCFSSTAGTTRKPYNLMRNIARDLANSYPAFKAALRNAVKSDLGLCTTEDLHLQFERFLSQPAAAVAVSGTVLIVIDAVDESGTVMERKALLHLLYQRLRELPPVFRVLITARPESDIENIMRKATAALIIKRMPSALDDQQTSSDILKYIRYTLASDGELPEGLTAESCTKLASQSEGVFQWAFVACNYITEQTAGLDARQRYERVVQGRENGLDSLYKAVLAQTLHPHSATIKEDSPVLITFRMIMGAVLFAVQPLSMQTLQVFLNILPEHFLDARSVLPFLGSVLSGVASSTEPVRPLHTSFRELLLDPSRAGPYSIGSIGHHELLATASLRLLTSGRLHFNMGALETSYILNRDDSRYQLSAEVIYACQFWGYHLSQCSSDLERRDRSIRQMISRFFSEKLLFWIDTGSVAGVIDGLTTCLSYALPRLVAMGDNVLAMATDAQQFLTRFERPIVDSAPHVYISALLWVPAASQLARTYASRMTAEVTCGRTLSWTASDVIMPGHAGPVSSVAFSRDGELLASGSHDNTIRLWNSHSGEAVGQPFVGHTDLIYSIALSPDGAKIASGSGDKTILLWNARTGAPIGPPLTGHLDSVLSVAFSPDGSQIASSSNDKTIRLWDAITSQPLGRPLKGHLDAISAVTFTPDGTRLVSASHDESVRVWDVKTGEPMGKPFTGHTYAVSSVAVSPDGTRVVSASWDGTLRIWDIDTGRVVGKPLIGHTGFVMSVAFSPDGAQIASGSHDQTIRLWNATTGAGMAEPLIGHTAYVRSVAFSPDSKQLVSGSGDNTIRVWNAAHDGPERELPFESVEKHEPNGRVAILPRLSLSPSDSEQPGQPYPARPDQSTEVFLDFESGWIKGSKDEHLLWVPPEMAHRLYTGRCQLVLPGPTITVDLSGFKHGTRWTESWA